MSARISPYDKKRLKERLLHQCRKKARNKRHEQFLSRRKDQFGFNDEISSTARSIVQSEMKSILNSPSQLESIEEDVGYMETVENDSYGAKMKEELKVEDVDGQNHSHHLPLPSDPPPCDFLTNEEYLDLVCSIEDSLRCEEDFDEVYEDGMLDGYEEWMDESENHPTYQSNFNQWMEDECIGDEIDYENEEEDDDGENSQNVELFQSQSQSQSSQPSSSQSSSQSILCPLCFSSHLQCISYPKGPSQCHQTTTTTNKISDRDTVDIGNLGCEGDVFEFVVGSHHVYVCETCNSNIDTQHQQHHNHNGSDKPSPLRKGSSIHSQSQSSNSQSQKTESSSLGCVFVSPLSPPSLIHFLSTIFDNHRLF